MAYDNLTDTELLALTLWKEARGEGPTGCQAVGSVIKNRVGFPGFAHTLRQVILGPNQFTSMSVESDPEFNLSPSANDSMYPVCQSIATDTLSGVSGDITHGAHYYANLVETTSGWFFRNIVQRPDLHPPTATIGKHTFFL